MRVRMLLAASALVVLAACEPDYSQQGTHASSGEAERAVTGGADPTAVSGRVKAPGEPNIQHPGAGGNDGRPPDGPGAAPGTVDTTSTHEGA